MCERYLASGLPAETMGRSFEADRDFFRAALAGGRCCAADPEERGARMSFERVGGEEVWRGADRAPCGWSSSATTTARS